MNFLFNYFIWAGKSTLLNHLFHTNFREMDAYKGRLFLLLLLLIVPSYLFICSPPNPILLSVQRSSKVVSSSQVTFSSKDVCFCSFVTLGGAHFKLPYGVHKGTPCCYNKILIFDIDCVIIGFKQLKEFG